MEKIIGTVPGKCRKKREKARLTLNNNPEISWHMKKSRRTYNGVHLNKKSNTQDVVEQSLTIKRYFYPYFPAIIGIKGYSFPYFPYLSGIMKIKTALYSLFSRLDWHKTVVFPCLGEIYEGIRSLSWEIPVT